MSILAKLLVVATGLIYIAFCKENISEENPHESILTNYGTFQHPSLNGLISSIPCTTHIMHYNLDFLLLKLNNPIEPLLISVLPPSLTLPMEYKYLQDRTVHHFYSRYYTRHRKFCYFYIFYSNPPWDTVTLGLLMRLYILQAHEELRRVRQELTKQDTNQAGYLYAIFITENQNFFKDGKVSRQKSQYLAYLRPDIFLLSVIPNFGLLFLSGKMEGEILCIATGQESYPIQKQLICHSRPHMALVNYFMPSYLKQNQFQLARDFPGLRENNPYLGMVTQTSNAALFLLMEILAPSCNLSIIPFCHSALDEKCSLPAISAGETPMFWDMYHWTSTNVVFGEKDLHFLTCYSKKKTSFDLYIKPFDFYTWMCLLGCVLLLVCALSGFASLASLNLGTSRLGLSALGFWALATLLDQVKGISGLPTKVSGFHLLLGVWVLLASIITSGYKSVVIMSLNIPETILYPNSFEVILTMMFLIYNFVRVNFNIQFL